MVAKSKIINNTVKSPKELKNAYLDYMASKVMSVVLSNDKKHSLAVGELESPSLVLFEHEDFKERFLDSIKKSQSFEKLCAMDPVELRECVMVNEKGLDQLTMSMVRESVGSFSKEEFERAAMEVKLTEEPKAPKKNGASKESEEALQNLF